MKQWPYVLGAVGVLGVFALLAVTRETWNAAPPGPPREPELPGAPLRWIQLEGPNVGLFEGDRYRACVQVPFGLGWAVSVQKIIDGATKQGFRVVSVTESPPAGWHSNAECDYFVEAIWEGADGKWVERPGAIELAWRLSRA